MTIFAHLKLLVTIFLYEILYFAIGLSDEYF